MQNIKINNSFRLIYARKHTVGSLKMNTALEYSTRVVQEGDRRCKKSTLNDLAYLTPLRIPLMNPVILISLLCAESPNLGNIFGRLGRKVSTKRTKKTAPSKFDCLATDESEEHY